MGWNSQTDDLKVYMRELSLIPLLTNEEERKLGERVQVAVAAGARDQAAEDALVRANLRHGFNVAKMGRWQNRGLSLADLIQEASLGLMRAAEDFNPRRGRFTTYATYWIKQHILAAIVARGRLIHVPMCQRRAVSVYENSEREGRDGMAEALRGKKNALRCSHTLLCAVAALRASTVSLEESLTCSDAVEQEGISVKLDGVLKAVESLEPREREVLVRCYGLAGGELGTLRTVGRDLGVSHQRVGQIKDMAINHVRELLGLASLEPRKRQSRPRGREGWLEKAEAYAR